MTAPPASIELYFGAPVEHASERAVLEQAYALARAAGIDAVILANFTVGGRQIDAVVATINGALLLEAKGCSSPINGALNGQWHMTTAAGEHNVRNGYQQALDAKNGLRDAMARIAPIPPYPDAAVVLVPQIPTSSVLPASDYKVQVIGLADLRLPIRSSAPAWTLERWRDFVRYYALARTPSLPALFDSLLLDAEQGLDDYVRLFHATYTPRQAELLAFPCRVSDRDASSDDLPDLLKGAPGLLIHGLSGCGKSLATLSTALHRLSAGDIPIFIEAKLFEGRLQDLLDREANLLGFTSAKALLSACRRTARPPLLVIDGYNECAVAHRLSLSRAIAAIARRTGAKVLVSSQVPLEGDLLDIPIVDVPRPTLGLKLSIAGAAATRALPVVSEALLDAVGSGLEARMLGEVGGDLAEGFSRFALFDLYVRRRLGQLGASGIETLSVVAGLLADRLSFSLSIRDFDRLQAAAGQDPTRIEALIGAGLLSRRGDRLSFGHELFQQAFQAEAVVRRAVGNAAPLARALEHPAFSDIHSFVLGAIDDVDLLHQVLAELSDANLLAKCLAGECGLYARSWVETRCEELFAAGVAEAEAAAYEICETSHQRLRATPESVRAWSKPDVAITHVLPRWLSTTERLPKLLDAARMTDERLAKEFLRLLPEAREKRVALRSGLFGAVYVWNALALSPAFCANSDLQRWQGTAEELAAIFTKMVETSSPGQTHILLQLARGVSGMPRLTAPIIPRLLERLWRGAPYHLRLEMLEAAGFCWAADDTDRLAVIDALEALGQIDDIMLSSQWLETMQQLGGLDTGADEHLVGLRERVIAMLAEPDDPELRSEAWSLYYGRFDHPYSSAYCAAYDELQPEAQTQILLMAGAAADVTTFFAGPLLNDLAATGSPLAAGPIMRWADLPPSDSFMPGDALSNYLLAHVALGRLGIDLPATSPAPSPAGMAIMHYAALLHTLNWSELEPVDRVDRIAAAWSGLGDDPGAAIAALQECFHVRLDRVDQLDRLPGSVTAPIKVISGHEEKVVKFGRVVLADPELLKGWFHPNYFDYDKALNFTLEILGRWGDASDLVRLRSVAHMPKLARTALEQIRNLETRLLAPSTYAPARV